MQLSKADKFRVRLEIVDERGSRCEGCNKPASDLHHGCIGDRKRLKEVLFRKENLIVLCRTCNVSRKYDNEKGRQYWWEFQVERYGMFEMLKWLGEVNNQCIIPFVFK